MSKFQAVKGSSSKGVRLTHSPKPISSGATSPDSVPGGNAGAGAKGASNVNGSGNGGSGDLKSGSGFPASGSGRASGQIAG